jgi:shikimate dehydrogenase
VLEPLLLERPQELLVVNRTASRAAQMATEFTDLGNLEGGGYDLIGARQFDLVINATSAGLSGAMLELPASLLTERSCCYDMVLVQSLRLYALVGTSRGLGGSGGMLVEQAAESFYIWRGVRPDTGPVINELRQVIAAADQSIRVGCSSSARCWSLTGHSCSHCR